MKYTHQGPSIHITETVKKKFSRFHMTIVRRDVEGSEVVHTHFIYISLSV